jgi:hypothetical protein
MLFVHLDDLRRFGKLAVQFEHLGSRPLGDLAKSCWRSERRALRKALVAIEAERVKEEGVRRLDESFPQEEVMSKVCLR